MAGWCCCVHLCSRSLFSFGIGNGIGLHVLEVYQAWSPEQLSLPATLRHVSACCYQELSDPKKSIPPNIPALAVVQAQRILRARAKRAAAQKARATFDGDG